MLRNLKSVKRYGGTFVREAFKGFRWDGWGRNRVLSNSLTSKVLDADERADRHERVMPQVEEGDLRVLFAQHEEHRVEELHDFRHVVEPDGSCHLK